MAVNSRRKRDPCDDGVHQGRTEHSAKSSKVANKDFKLAKDKFETGFQDFGKRIDEQESELPGEIQALRGDLVSDHVSLKRQLKKRPSEAQVHNIIGSHDEAMNDEFQNRIDTAKAEIMAKVEDTQERQSTMIEAVVLSGAEEHKSAICTMQDSIDTLQKEMKMFHDAQNNISSRVEVMEKIILGPMPRNAKSPQDKDASSEPSATRMHGTATQQHSVDLVKFDRDLGNTSETCSGQAKNMSALWEALSELELLRAEMHKVVRLQDTLKCDQETSHIALRNLRRNQPSITSRLTAIGHAQDILTTNFKDYAGYISTSLENSKLHTNHLHTQLSAQQDRDKTDRASLHQRMDMLDKRLDKFEQRNRDAARLQLQLLTESDAPPALRGVPTQDRDQQSVQTRQQPPPPFPSPPPQFPNQQLQQHAQKQGHQQPLLAPDTKASQTPGPQRQNHPLQPLQYHGSSVPQPALHNVPVIDLGRFLKSIQH